MSASTFSSSPLVVRLHISGLDSSRVTPTDLENRFNTFGQVLSISRWPPPLNAVGQPQNFAYVTLKSTPEQIHRCMNLLSGTMWKGGKIRVAEAKRDWTGHYGGESGSSSSNTHGEKIVKLPRPDDKMKEQAEAEKAKKNQEKMRRRKANAREQITVAKGNVITQEDVKAGKVWGWRITPAGHLLRPMQMRPSHPIPPVTNKSNSSSTNNTKRNNKRHSQQSHTPPTRARNQIIDPARYGAIHLSDVMLDDGEHENSIPGEIWICEEEEEGGDTGRVKWVRKRGNGVVDAEEVTIAGGRKGHQRHAHTPSDDNKDSRTREATPEPEQQPLSPPTQQPPSPPKPPHSSTSDPSITTTTTTPSHGTFQFQPYDPRQDEEFSDGYAEDDDDHAPLPALKKPTKDAMQLQEDQRKQAEIKLLRDMFGDEGLEQVRLAGAGANGGARVMDTDSEEEVQQETKTLDAEPAQRASQLQSAPERVQEESEESEEEEDTGGAWWSKPLGKSANQKKQEQSKPDAALSRAVLAERERRSLFDDEDDAQDAHEHPPLPTITAEQVSATANADSGSDSSSSDEDSSESGSDSDEDGPITKPVAPTVAEDNAEDSSDESDSSSSSSASSSSSSSNASSAETRQQPSKEAIDIDTRTHESHTQEPSKAMDVDMTTHESASQEPPKALDAPTQETDISKEQSEIGPPVNRTRGALLRAALSSRHEKEAEQQQQKGFLPVSRFEPATVEEETSVPPAGTPANAPSSNPMPTAAEPGFEVHMSSLKDMFKPQESSSSAGGGLFGGKTASGIFGDSWLGDEELDEDVIGMGEDLAEESAPPKTTAFAAAASVGDDSTQPRQATASTSSNFFFFPSTAKDATRDPIAGLKRKVETAFTADTPSEIQAKWEERKSTLTQDYKRRHREAVKKRKRGVVVAVRGSGDKSGGGKEMHLQRVQSRTERQAGASASASISAAGGANAVEVGAGSKRWGRPPA